MPKRGRGGSERGRIAMLHALAHIEFSAIDLAFDLAGRFGAGFPSGFVDDWFGVGADEAMHFALLDRRLRSLGSAYGELPAHDGLWAAAAATAGDPLARLAVVPMVLEARGLDVTPAAVARFEAAGDTRSAAILGRIYRDEIRHVGAGSKWFRRGCESRRIEPVATWKRLVGAHFGGALKPPFNDSARDEAARETRPEAAGEVEGEIDRREFDMGERVEHRDPAPFGAAASPLGHLRRRQKRRPFGPGGRVRHRDVELGLELAPAPGPGGGAGRSDLGSRLGGEEDGAGGPGDGGGRRGRHIHIRSG
jgi:uncharacterized ferritin-like protein (DUF455 family)